MKVVSTRPQAYPISSRLDSPYEQFSNLPIDSVSFGSRPDSVPFANRLAAGMVGSFMGGCIGGGTGVMVGFPLGALAEGAGLGPETFQAVAALSLVIGVLGGVGIGATVGYRTGISS